MHPSLSTQRKSIIAASTGFSEGTYPFNYLGAPISYKKLSASNLEFLIDKVSKKVAGWKGKLLSAGAKITLIKAVLSSMPLHILAILKPKTVSGKKFGSLGKELQSQLKKVVWVLDLFKR